MTDSAYAPPGCDVDTGTPRMRGSVDGAVGWIVFNNPERHNALARDMWEAIPRLIEMHIANPAVRVIVLRGAGDRAFASGADISEFETERAMPDAVARYDALVEHATTVLDACLRPTVAMIRGHCMGGGLAVALSCDLRLAAADAGFSIPAARLGVGYRASSLKTLVDLVGPAFAKEIIITARRFDAEEAAAMGLVNRVVPVGELDALVRDYVHRIAENAPLTIEATKRIVAELGRPGGPDHAACDALVERCFKSEDYVEGRRAFMAKRKPVFRGH